MGDRANIVVKQGDEQVCLYSHWGGSGLDGVLARALKRGKSRWDDFQYLTRIIFCEMIDKEEWRELTGYGISQNVHDGDDKVIVVNVGTGTVIDIDGDSLSLEAFVAMHDKEVL